MGDTRQNQTVAGSGNSIYAAQAGESPGPELSEMTKVKQGRKQTEEKRKVTDDWRRSSHGDQLGRQDGSATIQSQKDIDKEGP